MCGIAGWYRRGGRPVPAAIVTAQCDAIFHRGPDDDGVLADGDFGFGMRRLSILDIAGGHQPMTTADGRHAIVFNGEIYNHRDVRARLRGAGHDFRTGSDTETILAGFAAWGDAVWPMLEGMFAVAIWDRDARRLTLARDPIGIKPLYVSEQEGGIAFGSELKTLYGLPGHRFDVDDVAIHDFFRFGHVRAPRSIHRQVRMLDPGTVLTVPAVGAAVERVYWSPRFRIDETVSPGDWVARMRDELLGATARHMQADVPVAAFLSGGVDSSAILAAMTRADRAPIKAFTIGYPGTAGDETAAAAEIARTLGCEHIVLPLTERAVIATLDEVLGCYDEPFADLAAIPTWHVSKLAAEHVKVVLCGEGGDELFAGYKRHRNARLIECGRPFVGTLAPIGAALGRMPRLPSTRGNRLIQQARRAFEFMALPDGYPQFAAATQTSSAAVRRRVYAPAFHAAMADAGADATPAGATGDGGADSALQHFLLADLTRNMPSAMLTRLDRASMAHSLEARVPLLSHRMIDWAMTVPDTMKLRRGTGKIVLRRAVAPWLPRSVMRRPKQGFQVPHVAWLRGDLGRVAQASWHDGGAAAAGYLDTIAVDRLFAEHRDGTADHARMLYAIMVLARWWQRRPPPGAFA